LTDSNASIFKKTFQIEGGDFQNAGFVSKQIKKILKQLNLNGDLIWRAMIASYEAEMNVVLYAHGGEVTLEITQAKLSIQFKDKGPGIPNVPLAMTEGFSTATREMRERGFGAGLGLPNMKKTADTFEISSIVGDGTTISLGFNVS
jgi:serine/threonine-protein kinase RsbT